jgi:CRP-like cAMP-binding protein
MSPSWQRLTDAEIQSLSEQLERIAPVKLDDLHVLRDLLHACELERGEFLLRAGERATRAGMVQQGLLREYYVMRDGTERTKAFVRAGDNTGSLADLLSDRPSRAFIVAEEPSRLILTDYARLRSLVDVKPLWTRWSLLMVERMFIAKADREYELLGLDAEARYAAFGERYPGLEGRVAARHIASYLGITPVHLSRLRRKRREQLNLG